jgi:AbrB family looped-hinge helix DNA binding protein
MLEIGMTVGLKGQVVIPAVFRRSLKIFPNDEVLFLLDGDKLIIKKPHQHTASIFKEIASSGKRFSRKVDSDRDYDEMLKERLK